MASAVPRTGGTALVVVNYASSRLLEENLVRTGLGRAVDTVVVVDNLTTDEERARVQALAAAGGWSVVGTDRNLGFGAGMNAGVARARELGSDVFVLLNPDATIAAEGIATLVEAARQHPTTLLSPVITRPDGSPWFRGAWVDVPHGRTRQSDGTGPAQPHPWLAGTCLVVHQRLWDLLGGFDESYFLYWEDVELSWRCLAVGGDLTVRADVRAVHSVGGTQGPSGKSPAYLYWNCRNRLLFAAQHLARRDILRWAVRTPGYARAVLLRGGRRQLLHPVAPLSAVVSGSWAGLRLAAAAWSGRRPRPSTTSEGVPS